MRKMNVNGAKTKIAVGILVSAATLALMLRHRGDPARTQSTTGSADPVVVASARAASPPPTNYLAPAPPEPSFQDPEQTVRYYGTVLEGERRALRAVEEALGKARGSAGAEVTIGRLEDMRADYQQRIQRHEAKLKR